MPRSSTDTSPPVRMQTSLVEETSGLVSSPSSVTATGAPYPLRLMKVAPLPERTVSSVSVYSDEEPSLLASTPNSSTVRPPVVPVTVME